MNQIVKALKETSAQAGTAKQWKLEELCKMAALEIDEKAATIATLTAFNESMQTDARKNTETIRELTKEIESYKKRLREIDADMGTK